jgi:hypothetical protein
MAVDESDEVKNREKSRHNGGIKQFFDPGRATRDSVMDTWVFTTTVSDDILNRGYKVVSAEVDETGMFLSVKFEKREDYVP